MLGKTLILLAVVTLLAVITTNALAKDKTVATKTLEAYFKTLQAENHKKLLKIKENAQAIIGLEVLVAASMANRPESRFGHSMIRLVMPGDSREDIVLSPVAWVTDEVLDRTKGLEGGYKLGLEIYSMEDLIFTYQRFEKRPVQRLVIESSPNQRAQVIDYFIKLNSEASDIADYRFLDNNCASAVLDALYASQILNGKRDFKRESLNIYKPEIPLDLSILMYDGLASLKPVQYIYSTEHILTEVKQKIPSVVNTEKLNSKAEANFNLWNENEIGALPQLSARTLYLFYTNTLFTPEPVKNLLIKELRPRLNELGSDSLSVYNVNKERHLFYDLCQNASCRADRLKHLPAQSKKLSLYYHRALIKQGHNLKLSCYDVTPEKKEAILTMASYLKRNPVNPEFNKNYRVIDCLDGKIPRTRLD